ncbi:protein BPS1 [Carex littledalei]|uniref:Protein BPS1 n=1 Tax=Carex littledalei TaxID=544730 RepID=A0A833QDR2_9POAL|nr:protein BPS1 [Carex littledalei]
MSSTERYSDDHSNPPKLNLSSILSPPPNSLSHFSDSISRLAATMSSISTPTDSSRDSHLDSTIALLNMCNTVLAQIEQLRLRCLRLKFAHPLLSSLISDHLSCARKALSEWEMWSSDNDSDLDLASVEEVEKTNVAVRRLREAIDSGKIANEEFRVAIIETEKVAEELTMGLDRLAAAVNKLFTVVMGSRNVVLDSYKVGVGPKKCK